MDWTAILKAVIERPCFDRPFVCDGMPDSSSAIVVGENPSTDMTTDWWHYWSETDGFNYVKFMVDYRKRKPRLLGTRLRFDHIRNAGTRVIETNFYRDQSPNGSINKVLNTPLIQLLIDNVPQLDAIIFHGDDAKALAHLLKIPKTVRKFGTRHFSREKTEHILDLLNSRTSAR